MSKQESVLKQLKNGKEYTAKQIAGYFKINNPYDVIYRLRAKGEAIYTNIRVTSRGDVVNKYRWNPR